MASIHKVQRGKRVGITEVPQSRKVEVCRVLHTHLKCGLKTAKDLAENAPIFVSGPLTESKARRLIAELQDAGATVAYSNCSLRDDPQLAVRRLSEYAVPVPVAKYRVRRWRKPARRCYELAGRFALDNNNLDSDPKVVHGIVNGGIQHAWVEVNGLIYDGTCGDFFDPEGYYSVMSATPLKVFDADELGDKIDQTGHWGPFTNARTADVTEGRLMATDENNTGTVKAVLKGYGNNKVAVIKVVKDLIEAGSPGHLGLAAAKRIVESAPCVVAEYPRSNLEAAAELVDDLVNAGATAYLDSGHGQRYPDETDAKSYILARLMQALDWQEHSPMSEPNPVRANELRQLIAALEALPAEALPLQRLEQLWVQSGGFGICEKELEVMGRDYGGDVHRFLLDWLEIAAENVDARTD